MKKAICIIVIILLVILIIVFLKNNNKTLDENANIVEQNTIENEETNEQVNEQIENVLENLVNEQNVVDNKQETTTKTEIFSETPKTSEEKAISIVKSDWGEDSNVDISIDGIDSSGNYIIAVRDKNTTAAKAFYTVNVANQTFNKRDMD